MASTPFLERDYHSLIVITWWALGEMLRIKSQPHRGKIGYLSFALYFAVLIAVVFAYSVQQIGYLIVLILHSTGYIAYTALPTNITGGARGGMLGKTSTDEEKKGAKGNKDNNPIDESGKVPDGGTINDGPGGKDNDTFYIEDSPISTPDLIYSDEEDSPSPAHTPHRAFPGYTRAAGSSYDALFPLRTPLSMGRALPTNRDQLLADIQALRGDEDPAPAYEDFDPLGEYSSGCVSLGAPIQLGGPSSGCRALGVDSKVEGRMCRRGTPARALGSALGSIVCSERSGVARRVSSPTLRRLRLFGSGRRGGDIGIGDGDIVNANDINPGGLANSPPTRGEEPNPQARYASNYSMQEKRNRLSWELRCYSAFQREVDFVLAG
ncbi:uncharacterized protein MKK02DRAFT_33828 [Dioszegia hungarica]|uniref:Uncharacterized protein n=1 Tax=Dioszegia hungarica TaxID=4972 RepID=A0AA38HA56_9TREE|nr:uncharacterized protein MKK02DRAFT_33828 [Dioszegia hungarica]KAI9636693.1 hypothetical protein MKK02DRAFT_33828 [Dioszegia hungarica]